MNLTIETSTNTSLELQSRDMFLAPDIAPDTTLVCEQGLIWLTQSDDFTDYILKPGDQMVVNKKGKVLIEALSEARLSIVHPN